MSKVTYKWIVGCLIAIIIFLTAFLIASERNSISVSFSECLSIAATLSSLILSVVAMFYTYFSGRDTMVISNKIQDTIKEIDKQVQQVSNDTKRNLDMLMKVKNGIQDIENGVRSSSLAISEIQNASTISAQDKEVVIDNMEDAKNSMMMFLKKMRE